MAVLRPHDIFRVLAAHHVKYVVIGNLGGTLYGSPLVTADLDVCPSRDTQNLVALAAALLDMDARIRTADTPGGIPFACDPSFLQQMRLLNLTTQFGDLDLSFAPAGTEGYGDLSRRAVRFELRDGIVAHVAALEDIIRSKEAANREKDRLALPTLRLLLQKMREGKPPTR